MSEIERRYVQYELRAEGDERRRIAGYAAIFNSVSEEIFGFVETIMPGAFAEVIARDDVRALINHDRNLVLGRTTAGTLRLLENEIGLRYEVDLPDTQPARDLMVSLDRGDVDQSSFGFRVDPEDEEWRGPDEKRPLPLRIIHRFSRLFDVSPVTFPAYTETSVALRVSTRALDKAKEFSSLPGRATGDGGVLTARAVAAGRRDLLRRKIQIAKLRG